MTVFYAWGKYRGEDEYLVAVGKSASNMLIYTGPHGGPLTPTRLKWPGALKFMVDAFSNTHDVEETTLEEVEKVWGKIFLSSSKQEKYLLDRRMGKEV